MKESFNLNFMGNVPSEDDINDQYLDMTIDINDFISSRNVHEESDLKLDMLGDIWLDKELQFN